MHQPVGSRQLQRVRANKQVHRPGTAVCLRCTDMTGVLTRLSQRSRRGMDGEVRMPPQPFIDHRPTAWRGHLGQPRKMHTFFWATVKSHAKSADAVTPDAQTPPRYNSIFFCSLPRKPDGYHRRITWAARFKPAFSLRYSCKCAFHSGIIGMPWHLWMRTSAISTARRRLKHLINNINVPLLPLRSTAYRISNTHISTGDTGAEKQEMSLHRGYPACSGRVYDTVVIHISEDTSGFLATSAIQHDHICINRRRAVAIKMM